MKLVAATLFALALSPAQAGPLKWRFGIHEREVVATPGESSTLSNVTTTSLRLTRSKLSTTFITPTTAPPTSPINTPTPEAEHHDSGSDLGDDGSEFNDVNGTPRPRFSSLTSEPPVASDLINGPQKETSSEETATPFRSLSLIGETPSETSETPSTTSSGTSSRESSTTPEASSTSVDEIAPPRDSSSFKTPVSSGDDRPEPTPQPTTSLSTTSIDPEEPVTLTPVLPTPDESTSTSTTSSKLQTPGVPDVPGRNATIPDRQTPVPDPTNKLPVDTTASSSLQTPTLTETSIIEPPTSSTAVSSSSVEVPVQPPPGDEPGSVTLTTSTEPATTAESTTTSLPEAVITFPTVGDTLSPSSSSSLDSTSVLPEEPTADVSQVPEEPVVSSSSIAEPEDPSSSLEPVQPPVASEAPTTTATSKSTSTQVTTVPPADGTDPNFPTVVTQTATMSLTPEQFQANLQSARVLNEQFKTSTPGPCVGNQVGCIDGKFANCRSGTFDIHSCNPGEGCFALPMDQVLGVRLGCVDKGKAEAILNGSTATGSTAAEPVAPTNQVSSESPGNALTQSIVDPVENPVATTSLVETQPAADPSPAPPPPPPPPPAADTTTTSSTSMFTSINIIGDSTTIQENPARPTNGVAGEGAPPEDVAGDSTTVINDGVPTVSVTVTKTVTEAAQTKTVTEKETITQNVTVDNVGDRVDVQHINTL